MQLFTWRGGMCWRNPSPPEGVGICSLSPPGRLSFLLPFIFSVGKVTTEREKIIGSRRGMGNLWWWEGGSAGCAG